MDACVWDDIFETFQFACDECAMRPWAGVRDLGTYQQGGTKEEGKLHKGGSVLLLEEIRLPS